MPGIEVLRFEVLGPLRVLRAESELDLGYPQARALLGVLLVRPGRPVRMSTIVDVLWPGRPPASAPNAVRRHVGALRKLLEPGLPPRAPGRRLLGRTGGYLLEASADEADLLRFRALSRRGMRAAATARSEQAVRHFDGALRLWRGPVAAGLPGPVRAHPHFAAVDREVLRTARMAADAALLCGRADQVLPSVRRAAALNPFDEPLLARLILSLAACGLQAEALATYEDARRDLAAQSGIAPGAELAAAHARVLRQQIRPARHRLPTGPPDPARPFVRPAQLPPDLAVFTGRERELAALDAVWGGEPVGAAPDTSPCGEPLRADGDALTGGAPLRAEGNALTDGKQLRAEGLTGVAPEPAAPNTWTGAKAMRQAPEAITGAETVPTAVDTWADGEPAPLGPDALAGAEAVPTAVDTWAGGEPRRADGNALTGGEPLRAEPGAPTDADPDPAAPNVWTGAEPMRQAPEAVTGAETVPTAVDTWAGGEPLRAEPGAPTGANPDPAAPNAWTGAEPMRQAPEAVTGAETVPTAPDTWVSGEPRRADGDAFTGGGPLRGEPGAFTGADPEPAAPYLRTGVEPMRLAPDALAGTEAVPTALDTVTGADALPTALDTWSGGEPLRAALTPLAGAYPVSAVLISGPAGIGKTALAIHWAHRIADRFPDGQLHLDLGGSAPHQAALEPAEALSRLLAALGVPARSMPVGVAALAAQYRDVLAGRRLLVLLDDAACLGRLRPLLPRVPGCLTLVTSRGGLVGPTAVTGSAGATGNGGPTEPARGAGSAALAGRATATGPLGLTESAGATAATGLTTPTAATQPAKLIKSVGRVETTAPSGSLRLTETQARAAAGVRVLELGLPSEADARDLLARRIGAARLAAEPEAVTEIIRRCGRLPSALALVAARAASRRDFALAALAADLAEDAEP
ncbi:AfsR/SARP family transcriptional regulator [Streptomyces sp. NRRL WC-3744]|uniref:AfsR/SARP family transcriptional regulator n=1 Tax=Streptomyces sp. NRRL WC-3744 TaxID=1463935 RepID=UPI000ACCC861|nr:AfsR/SARP family transcriptional regulator [Streptomyces sp. NRRL WC-3744]